jgi:hypothetical protein
MSLVITEKIRSNCNVYCEGHKPVISVEVRQFPHGNCVVEVSFACFSREPGRMNDVFIMHRDSNDDGHTLEKRLQDGLRPSGRGTKEGVYFRIPRVYNHRAYDALLSDVDRIKYLYPDLFEYNIASAHVDNNIVYFSTLGYDSKCVVKNQNTKDGSMTIGKFLNYMDNTPRLNTMEREILFQGQFPAIAAYMQFRKKEEHITEVSLTICSGGARPKHTTYYDLYDSYYITSRQHML